MTLCMGKGKRTRKWCERLTGARVECDEGQEALREHLRRPKEEVLIGRVVAECDIV